MEFNRKFYAVTPRGGGGAGGGTGGTPPPTPPPGPSDDDLSRAEKLNQLYAEMRSTLGDISVLWRRELNQEARVLDDATGEIVKNLGKELYSTLQAARKETTRLSDKTSELRRNVGSSKQIQERINETIRRQNALQDIANELIAAKGELTEKEQEFLKDATAELDKQLAIYRKLRKQTELQEKSLGALGVILKGLGNLPFIGGFISRLIQADKILDSMKKKAQEGGSALEIMGEGLMQLGTNIGVGLIGLLVKGFEQVIKLVIQFNQKTFDFAKNLGVSVGKAGELQGKLMAIAHSNFMLSKEVQDTYSQLTNALGFLVPTSRAFSETAALIQKRLGASADQMTALATASAISGKRLNQAYGIIQASAKLEGARNKLYVTQRQILEGIAKTSATVLLNFKGDIEALSAAIVRATKLGTTLEQVNKQASSLLDFETSIASEIEATVVTGRETNLNRARELALANKTAELMEELNKQGVTYNQFLKLNAIEREVEAKRIGLTTEEYAKILLQQKQAQELGVQQGQSLSQRYDQLMKTVEGQKRLREVLSEQELSDLRRQSIQDKFNATLEKFKEILGSMLQGPVTRMLEKFIAFVSNTERMKALASKIKEVFEGIERTLSNIPAIMEGAVKVAKVLASLSAATAAARVVMGLGLGGPLGVIAGASAGYAMYNWLSGLIDGAMSGMSSNSAAPAIPTPAASTSMATPVNTAAASAEGRSTRARNLREAGGGEGATASNTPGHVYLDGQKVGQVILGRNSTQLYGLNMA